MFLLKKMQQVNIAGGSDKRKHVLHGLDMKKKGTQRIFSMWRKIIELYWWPLSRPKNIILPMVAWFTDAYMHRSVSVSQGFMHSLCTPNHI